jgi:hypothetical protein
MKSFGIKPKRTSFRSPWQNGVAERWVGNCRRDLLDHVIVLNERHLKRLMSVERTPTNSGEVDGRISTIGIRLSPAHSPSAKYSENAGIFLFLSINSLVSH